MQLVFTTTVLVVLFLSTTYALRSNSGKLERFQPVPMGFQGLNTLKEGNCAEAPTTKEKCKELCCRFACSTAKFVPNDNSCYCGLRLPENLAIDNPLGVMCKVQYVCQNLINNAVGNNCLVSSIPQNTFDCPAERPSGGVMSCGRPY